MIIFTVTRASGLEWQGKLDVLWEVYFQIVAAEIGLILVSTTAFRALYVSRAARNQQAPQKYPSLLMKSTKILRKVLDPRRWISKQPKDMTRSYTPNNEIALDGKLPSIPGATMTGINTYIQHHGEEA